MAKLERLRKQIDQLDLKVLALLVQRALMAKKIGQVKTKLGSEIYSSSRENEILDRLKGHRHAPLANEDVESIFKEIFHACRNIQKKLNIAYLGPEATFTHQLAMKHFGKTTPMSAQKSISDVFVEVEKNRADYGVVPIENSTEGVVNHTLDMFIESDLLICAEREEPITHHLLSASGQIPRIKRIYSHPQALGQCRRWIESHLTGVEVHDSASTADAACQSSLDASAAAIASELAARLYNLKIVARAIEDFQENYTRFLIIGKHPAPPSGKDKTSVLISIKDKVGALNEILMIFKKFGINLTKIESRPSKKKAWEYIFFVDFMGHFRDTNIEAAMQELKGCCLYIKILGSYPRSD